MGREVRMVPPNWDHPKTMRDYGCEDYQPMFDQRFEDAAKQWKEEFFAWERGDRPDYADESDRDLQFWEWGGMPPDRKYYRPWRDDEATWFQVWETVSEGTPVTPPFATKEELVDYLAAHGDFWDQKRGDGPWKREAAEGLVNAGWVPSLTVLLSNSGVQINAPRDGVLTP